MGCDYGGSDRASLLLTRPLCRPATHPLSLTLILRLPESIPHHPTWCLVTKNPYDRAATLLPSFFALHLVRYLHSTYRMYAP